MKLGDLNDIDDIQFNKILNLLKNPDIRKNLKLGRYVK